MIETCELEFDYAGYDIEELLYLCNDEFAERGSAKWIYWPSEVYSFGRLIREYGFYPKYLPLYVYSNHGVTGDYEIIGIPKHEINNEAFCMFCLNDKNTKVYRTVTNKRCYTLYSPYVFYRRKNNIRRALDARGTLVFPAHTTPDIDDETDIDLFIDQLKQLPEEYQPICICLHYHDVNKSIYKRYQKRGLPVYTVGSPYDLRFVERFYSLIKNFKYSASNMIGSYTFYSIEMNIPFFIIGERPVLINRSDKNIEKGDLSLALHDSNYHIFNIKNLYISKTKQSIYNNSLGLDFGVSRIRMSIILYLALIDRIYKSLCKRLLIFFKYSC